MLFADQTKICSSEFITDSQYSFVVTGFFPKNNVQIEKT